MDLFSLAPLLCLLVLSIELSELFMGTPSEWFAPRPINEVKAEFFRATKENRNPFLYTVFEEVAPVIDQEYLIAYDCCHLARYLALKRSLLNG
jgi:hypothetical protein